MAGSDKQARTYDVVLFGATGFTGGLTAEYLARSASDGLRWALAGRNQTKLEQVRTRLVAINPALKDLPLLVADASDRASLDAVATSTKVVVTTVGPYLEHGEPLVAACAEAGTDYCDLTGEPEFVDRMYLDHHETAQRTGARIVHACGFDSIPYDIGAFFTMKYVPKDVPVKLTGVIRAGGTFSGGTFHSALNQFSRAKSLRATTVERLKKEGRPEGRRVKTRTQRPHRDSRFGCWLVPLPTIDPIIVARSAAALPSYGPDFVYSHYAGVKRLPTIVGSAVGLTALFAAAQVGPVRRLLLSRVPQGEGPSEAKREKSWFSMRFLAEADGQVIRTEVSGGDPGYGETAKMLAEAAQCLALDDNPPTSGQVTTAQAMGDNLLSRLTKAGLRFDLVSGDEG
jgi:saccharopine dehydrogenase (NAD+, L-glutamate forming)